MLEFGNDAKIVLFGLLVGPDGPEYVAFRQCEPERQIWRIKHRIAGRGPDDAIFNRLPAFASLAADPTIAMSVLALIPKGAGLDLTCDGDDDVNQILITEVLMAAGKDLVERFMAGTNDGREADPRFVNLGIREIARGYIASAVEQA